MARQIGWVPRLLIGVVLLYIGILILWPVAAIFQGAFSEGMGAFVAILNKADVQNAFWLTFELATIVPSVPLTTRAIAASSKVSQNAFCTSALVRIAKNAPTPSENAP